MALYICRFVSVVLILWLHLVLPCPPGYFRIGLMSQCRPWLTCQDLSDVQVGRLVGSGAVKAVFFARWKGVDIAYNELINDDYADDFLHGIHVLQTLQQSNRVTRIVGFCSEKYILLTEFHHFGDLRNVSKTTLQHPLEFCWNFLSILMALHAHTDGPWVLCDVTSINKTETQFLLSERAGIPFVLNDVDSLASVSSGGIQCGSRRFTYSDEFIAPEMVTSNHYDEKIDIWKVPAVCNFFLSKDSSAHYLQYKLHRLYQKCRQIDPRDRPPATDLVYLYEKLLFEIKDEL